MKYKMKTGSTTVEDRINTTITNATNAQFEKFMPQEPAPEVVREFLVAELNELIIACADVEGHGGAEVIAHHSKVEPSFVRWIEAKLKEEWARRQAANEV